MIRRALANLALVAGLGFGVLSHPAAAPAAEPAATPPANDTGPVAWPDPSEPPRHAPSTFGRTYPAATQAARDWAWRRVGAREWRCLDAIGHFESGWRVHAGNPAGSYGLGQANPAAKMRPYGADYLTNPLTQVRWMVAYANGRYGSPCAAWQFWQRNHWW